MHCHGLILVVYIAAVSNQDPQDRELNPCALFLSEGFVNLKMASIRCTINMIVKEIFHPLLPLRSERMFQMVSPNFSLYCATINRGISNSRIRCAADSGDGGKKISARLSQVQQLLQEAEERSLSFGDEPTPKITLGI